MSTTPLILTPAESKRRVAGLRRNSVPIERLGALTLPGTLLPVVELDARKRPDVADLQRVHAADGEGEHRHTLPPFWARPILTPTPRSAGY